MNAATILDLDAMLDQSMAEVETIPDYMNPPVGLYQLAVAECKTEKFDKKAKDGKDKSEAARIRIVYAVMATLETEEIPVADKTLFSESFMITEEGLKYFKKQAMNILNVPDLDGATLRDVIDTLNNTEFKAKITVSKTKGPDGTVYENLRIRAVHDTAAS